MEVTIKRVSHFSKDKEGNDLMGSNGKKYTRCLIDVAEYDSPLSGFGNAQTSVWKEGDKVDVEVTEVEKNGNKYYNFSLPKQARGGSFTESDRELLTKTHALVEQILTRLDNQDVPFL